MPQTQPEAPVEPEMPQNEPQNPEPNETPPQENEALETQEPEVDKTAESVENLSKNFDEFKGEVKGIIQTEIGNLTKTIKDALK